ncbi:MAG: hypothetical protein L6R38_007120 [Xanthoria sp. 2 TBL-2021]|nr:MAG: hypothetical protein L6R38_007120 [Xanthoria sp. 2 TBL-2021]
MDLTESQFLKNLFNFDVSHEVQLSRIITKAKSLERRCGPFQREITGRITTILHERSQYHRATYIANPDSMDDPYPTALLHYYRQVQKVEKKRQSPIWPSSKM